MDFTSSPETVEFRREVQAVLDQWLTDDVRRAMEETGTYHDWGLYRAIAERGWLAAGLPESLGGQGRDAEQLSALFGELERAGAPYDGISNTMMLAYILGQAGSDFHRHTVQSALLSGEATIALGYSEPESGSDVAAAATRARRDGDGWMIDGQKMFTSMAEEARWVFLLTRTNADVPKHRGLTFFIVPLDAEGVEIQSVRTMSGKRTNITFYDNVHVGDEWRVGEVDGGWDVMMVALSFERGIAGGWGGGLHLYDHAVAYFQSGATDDEGRPLIESPHIREQMMRTLIGNEVSALLAQRAAWVAISGELPGQEGSECKLFATESFIASAEGLLDCLGSSGVLEADDADGTHAAAIEHAYRFAPVTSIWGGTSEIQKNLIAERGLGLPRTRGG